MAQSVDPHGPAPALSMTQWLIVILAAIGFAFDIYELLMLPLILAPAVKELGGYEIGTDGFFYWRNMLFYVPAVAGGIFGLLGGYLTDWLGRRRVLTWSILLYACSAFAAGFSTNLYMLLVLRCLTFIGFCVEFVAAVAWLSELFTHPAQRERILGYTQAFSSFGGLLVALVFGLCNEFGQHFPAIWLPAEWIPATFNPHAAWRYTLMSGLLPALPLVIIRPFLPESPVWQKKRDSGTLKRPNILELFSPGLARTTIVTTLMMACVYGTALGAIQVLPDITRSLPEVRESMAEATKGIDNLKQKIAVGQKVANGSVKNVTTAQEIGGLIGRFALALLVVVVVSRRMLLRIFQVPGLFLVPMVFLLAPYMNVYGLMAGAALAGFFTVAQLSFWGNYLPRVYPVHLRGTGESFAANVGGRLIGTSAAVATTELARWIAGANQATGANIATAAMLIAAGTYFTGFVLSFFLPEPGIEELPE